MYHVPMTPAASRARADSSVSAVDAFHALSDETRLAVLEMLRDGERCVCDLQAALDAAQSRLSFHLKVLKDAGLVTDRKEGRWSYYALNAERFAELEAVVAGFAAASATPRSSTLHALTRAVRRPVAVRASKRDDGCC
jgi:ArsR family transcriptional regulator